MVAPFEGNACGHNDITTAADVHSSRAILLDLSKEQNINTLRSVELFSGCGGLALGTARAGFSHDMMVEWNEDACATLSLNKANGVQHAKDWNPRQGDVRAINWGMISGQLDLVAGGPPCQPFSVGGKARGSDDARDMWPEAIRAVRELRPRSFMFENVRGLTREAFKDYLGWIVASLARPSMVRNEDEDVSEHLDRLTKCTTPAEYKVIVLSVNAADFGAAQKRHRVIVAGVRADLGLSLTPLVPTHSHERLLWEQWISGEYWIRHGLSAPTSGPSSIADGRIVDRLRATRMEPTLKAWRTVRDAISGLGEPDGKNGHILQVGARVYPGHTGSPLDEPAKALKAGAHGVPGGENMLVKDDGSVRYFTIREAASQTATSGRLDLRDVLDGVHPSARQRGSHAALRSGRAVDGQKSRRGMLMAKQPKQQKDPAAPYNPLAKANLAKSIQTEILDCPLLPMTAAAGIVGAGVYAIYYVGNSSMYGMISPRVGTEPTWPIYVGKAIPEGGRKGGIKENASLSSDALAKRLMNHESSLTQACNLDPADFRFRFLVVDDIWIPLGENALIETFAPVWNAVVDGFGNNNPGKGRHKQQRSPWDTLHPGRPWAESLIPKTKKQHGVDMDVTPDEIVLMISSHLESTMTGRS